MSGAIERASRARDMADQQRVKAEKDWAYITRRVRAYLADGKKPGEVGKMLGIGRDTVKRLAGG